MNPRRNFIVQGISTVFETYKDLTWDVLKFAKLALTGKLKQIPVSVITDEFAFSLAPNGWNYYCELVSEHEKHPERLPQHTTFYQFFQRQEIVAVQQLADILFLHDPEKRALAQLYPFHLGTYPWGGLFTPDRHPEGTPFGWYYDLVSGAMTRDLWGYKQSLWYKPDDVFTLGLEWNYTIQNYYSLSQGYRPLLYGSFPSVALLVRADGNLRAVMVDGHHRLCILKHLGYEQVTVEVTRVVSEKDVQNWHYVTKGHCSPEQALKIFHAFFELTGQERLLHLGNLHGHSS
jgi:hypothetical protein